MQMTFRIKERGKTTISHIFKNSNGEYTCVSMGGESTEGSH